MNVEIEHTFAAPLERVMAMFADPDFVNSRSESAGARNVEVLVDGDADAEFTVAVRRTMATSSVPQEFRGLVGDSLSVRYNEAWEAPDDDMRDGTFAVEIVGVPARASGTLALVGRGDSTVLSVEGAVKTTMPLLAGIVEKAIGDALTTVLDAELQAADEWLAAK